MIFSTIKNYSDYIISSSGEIYSLKNGGFHRMATNINIGGYKRVGLCKNGKQKYFLVHRLVAETFINNPECKPCINHKDENKLNNNVENLEWCTVSENNRYGSRLNRIAESNKKKILQLDLDGQIIKKWNSQTDASRDLKLEKKNINACLKNKRRVCGGYQWRYLND